MEVRPTRKLLLSCFFFFSKSWFVRIEELLNLSICGLFSDLSFNSMGLTFNMADKSKDRFELCLFLEETVRWKKMVSNPCVLKADKKKAIKQLLGNEDTFAVLPADYFSFMCCSLEIRHLCFYIIRIQIFFKNSLKTTNFFVPQLAYVTLRLAQGQQTLQTLLKLPWAGLSSLC